MLVLTDGTDIKSSFTDPIVFVFAFLADETMGPFQGKQIIVTSVWI